MKVRLVGAVAGTLLVADGLTKWAVARSFRPGDSVALLDDLVRLTYVRNPGAAFGLHVGPFTREIFTALALVATGLILAIIVRSPAAARARLAALALILGGAVGNLVDRIVRPGGVVDFLDVGMGSLRWPVFNLADVGVTTGAVLLLLLLGSGPESVGEDAPTVRTGGQASRAEAPAAEHPRAERFRGKRFRAEAKAASGIAEPPEGHGGTSDAPGSAGAGGAREVPRPSPGSRP